MIPHVFQLWLNARKWQLRSHQIEMLHAYKNKSVTLLLAPTGAGKTLAGFLPVLIDLYQNPKFKGLHTLYISPLKSLTNDIARNLQQPILEMKLEIQVESRTGDTSSYRRARQKKKPPHILLTTPESLALLLTYPEAEDLFKSLQAVIIDEIHSLAPTKRGDQTSLLLARLKKIAPLARLMGLSATVADPPAMQTWLDCNALSHIIQLNQTIGPTVDILYSATPLPLAGHYPSQELVQKIYEVIAQHNTALVFVNTRAQAERLFQSLWALNSQNFSIGLHHGSLSKEKRLKIEAAMTQGKLKAVVATSSLDLGIDWGNVDIVVNVGAPKGISRLTQRIGRSNHQLEVSSKALLVPTNSFEALECQAALQEISNHALDDPPLNKRGALDVLAQHIMSCACAAPLNPNNLYEEIRMAFPYHELEQSVFIDTFNFVINGGYALSNYERYQRLVLNSEGSFEPRSSQIKQYHRMNMGTIVEAEKLKVMLVSNKPGGKRRRGKGLLLGEIEERLILGLEPGDTFLFGGRVLRYESVRDLIIEATPSASLQAKVPSFLGGKMPLSSQLASAVLKLLESPHQHQAFPLYLQEWLQAQKKFSCLPSSNKLLVELFSRQGLKYLTAYTFQGRPINQTLGFLLSHRLESAGCQPLGFAVSDYGLSLWCLKAIPKSFLKTLWDHNLYETEFENWLKNSSMLKRFFRTTAIISGLIQRKLPGHSKTGKQVTFSTDLIYDVLNKYDPNHLLLRSAREDVERELIGLEQLKHFLLTHKEKVHYQACQRITPFAIPIILDSSPEGITASGSDALLALHSVQERAVLLYQEATDA